MTIRRISVLQKEAYSDNKWIFLFWLHEEWKTQKLEFVVRQLYSAKITVNGTSLNVEKKQHGISHNWRGHFRIIHEGSINQIWKHPFGNRADPGNGHFPNIQVWILVQVLWGFGCLVFKMFPDRQKSSRQDAWYQNYSALLTSSSEHTVYRSTSQVLKSVETFEHILYLLVGCVYQSNWRNFWLWGGYGQ